MSKVIGYMEGTDPLWLTTLQLLGFSTLPVSNGLDGHGKNIQLIDENRRLDLIICYLHKLIPVPGADQTVGDLLHRTKVYDIPVLSVCPRELQEQALAQAPPDTPDNVYLIDPSEVVARIKELLG